VGAGAASMVEVSSFRGIAVISGSFQNVEDLFACQEVGFRTHLFHGITIIAESEPAQITFSCDLGREKDVNYL
jgi:hypothetical protein